MARAPSPPPALTVKHTPQQERIVRRSLIEELEESLRARIRPWASQLQVKNPREIAVAGSQVHRALSEYQIARWLKLTRPLDLTNEEDVNWAIEQHHREMEFFAEACRDFAIPEHTILAMMNGNRGEVAMQLLSKQHPQKFAELFRNFSFRPATTHEDMAGSDIVVVEHNRSRAHIQVKTRLSTSALASTGPCLINLADEYDPQDIRHLDTKKLERFAERNDLPLLALLEGDPLNPSNGDFNGPVLKPEKAEEMCELLQYHLS